jgi:uncharacterized repeat protein (TIGR01451 family)
MFRIIVSLLVITSMCSSRQAQKSVGADAMLDDGMVTVQSEFGPKQIPINYKLIDATSLKPSPPIPTGYKQYQNLFFTVESQTSVPLPNIAPPPYVVTIKIPASINEKDFAKLRLLHLEHDESSPTSLIWRDETILSGRWSEELSPSVPKTMYERSTPDFEKKTISTISEEWRAFAVAIQDPPTDQPRDPFTQFSTKFTHTPELVKLGDNVTITITLTNKGSKSAGEVNLINDLDLNMRLRNFTFTQGSCRVSNESGRRTLCNFGAVPGGASVTLTIVAQLARLRKEDGPKAFVLIDVQFKEHPADLQNNVNRFDARDWINVSL